MRRPIPLDGVAPDLPLSPAIRSEDHVFLTGATGSGPDGAMPRDPEAQFNAAFDKIGQILAAAHTDLHAIVEMTSFHVGLNTHFDTFDRVVRTRLAAPFPAWTAVGLAELRRPGALVEIRVIAHAPSGA